MIRGEVTGDGDGPWKQSPRLEPSDDDLNSFDRCHNSVNIVELVLPAVDNSIPSRPLVLEVPAPG